MGSETKPAFTPGPWRAVRQCVGRVLRDWNGDGGYDDYASFVQPLDIQVYGPDVKFNRAGSGPSPDLICANAHLIAAAPDLYEACAEFVRRVEAGEIRSKRTYARMKEVLAKARGETTREQNDG